MHAYLFITTAFALSGCGYHLVRASGTQQAVGQVQDLSVEGDLGLRAEMQLREAAPEHIDGTRLVGTVRTAKDVTAGFDGAGQSSAYHAAVDFELRLVDAGGVTLWSSGWVQRAELYVRGLSPVESLGARRRARQRALDRAVRVALARLNDMEAKQ